MKIDKFKIQFKVFLMKSPLDVVKKLIDGIEGLDDGLEKSCANLATGLEEKKNIGHMAFMNRYAVLFTVLGLATNNGWAMAVGPMQGLAVVAGVSDKELATGSVEDKERRKSVRLLLVALVLYSNIPSLAQHNYMQEFLDYLAEDSALLQTGGDILAWSVDRFGDIGAALYFYFMYGKTGDGLGVKTKNAVNGVLSLVRKPAEA